MYKKILILTCFTVISLSTASSELRRQSDNEQNALKEEMRFVIMDATRPMKERKNAMSAYILTNCRCSFNGNEKPRPAIHIDLSSLNQNDAWMLYCLEFGGFYIKYHKDWANTP